MVCRCPRVASARVLIPFMIIIATGIASAQSAAPPALPSSITFGATPSGRPLIAIRGLLGTKQDQAKFGSYLADPERVDRFGEAVIDTLHDELRLVDDARGQVLQDLVNRLARESNVVPYWEELVVRDLESPDQRPGLYRVVWVRQVHEGVMSLLAARTATGGGVALRFAGSEWSRAGSPVIAADVAWNAVDGFTFTAAVVDTVIPSAFPGRDAGARETPLVLPGGGAGRAALNRLTAHCESESENVLRVYDAGGRWIWKAPLSAPNVASVTAADLDGDGSDEIVVSSVSHGRASVALLTRAGEGGATPGR